MLSGAEVESIDPGGLQRRPRSGAATAASFSRRRKSAPGVIQHEHGNKFPIGEPLGQRSDRVERCIGPAAAVSTRRYVDIRDEIWPGWGNLCFNPISALTLATIDVVTGDPDEGDLPIHDDGDAVHRRASRLRLRVDLEKASSRAQALGPHKMSMLQDPEHGREMEIEPLVGVVQELGLLTKVPTPIW
jgi:2-dehydropantoate 2-reductase